VGSGVGRRFPERTEFFFRAFSSAANKQNPHPLDLGRFYHFILAAQYGRTKLLPREVEERLRAEGFPRKVAEELADVFHHGRELLRNRIQFNYVPWRGAKER
jgi:hypothetical protein